MSLVTQVLPPIAASTTTTSETIAFDSGIVNLLKDGRHTARERFGVGKSGVDVAAGDFEFKVVEGIGNEPDERIVSKSRAVWRKTRGRHGQDDRVVLSLEKKKSCLKKIEFASG